MERGMLTLSPILCDGVILQRDSVNRIYGTETAKDTVTVHFMGNEYCAKVDQNFDFCVDLPPVAAGGPYSMTVTGSREITISDILFGDVYILSGQSNMELPIRRVLDVSAEEISKSSEPTIRQYLIPASYNFSEPNKYMHEASWEKAMDEELMNFSAVGYFFAKEIKEKYQVPVGLIMTAVGGSHIEAWMNPVTLRKFGDYEEIVEKFKDKDYFKDFIERQQNTANEWIQQLEETKPEVMDFEEVKTWDTCLVPSMVSDYGECSFQGSVYLCKEVNLQEEPTTEEAHLYMGSIIDSDRIWINGTMIGRTEYRYPPRKYKIPSGVLRKGRNLITVRIVINNGNGGFIKGKPYYLFAGNQKIPLAGEWYYRIGKKAETAMPEVLFPPKLPIGFYHATIVPTSKISVKAVLWYQGESNTGDPEDYAAKFSAMVKDWRALFASPLPFLYVQLANFREPLNKVEETGWAELRNQQRMNLSISETAMAVIFDIGESNDLHPQNKKEVGIRLSKAAQHLIYHEDITYSGPIPSSASIDNNTVVICFQHLEEGDKEVRLNNFELAGTDGRYYPASAIRKGNRVYVSCEHIELPATVRYAWCDNPTDINFYNDAGLPATGFRWDVTV